MAKGQNLKDVLANTEELLSMHPTPWGLLTIGCDIYVVDANGKFISCGKKCEGYVSKDDKETVALVDVINSLGVYLKGEK